MNGCGFVLQERPDGQLDRPLSGLEYLAARQVEGGIFRMTAGQRPQPGFAQAIDQPADPGPVDRAGAHGAGLRGGIERGAGPEDVGAVARAGGRREQPLGVGGAVMRRHVAVLGFDQDAALAIDQDGAERVVAVAGRAARRLERAAQRKIISSGRFIHSTMTVMLTFATWPAPPRQLLFENKGKGQRVGALETGLGFIGEAEQAGLAENAMLRPLGDPDLGDVLVFSRDIGADGAVGVPDTRRLLAVTPRNKRAFASRQRGADDAIKRPSATPNVR